MLPEIEEYFDNQAEMGYYDARNRAYVDYDTTTVEAERDRQAAYDNAGEHIYGQGKCPRCVAVAAADLVYDEATAGPRLIRDEALKAAELAYAKAPDRWSKLAESSDPVVRWIGENCRNDKTDAEKVLRILPATLDEIRQVARENGWCDAYWGNLYSPGYERRAVGAGLFPKPEVSGNAARYGDIEGPCGCSWCVAEREADSAL